MHREGGVPLRLDQSLLSWPAATWLGLTSALCLTCCCSSAVLPPAYPEAAWQVPGCQTPLPTCCCTSCRILFRSALRVAAPSANALYMVSCWSQVACSSRRRRSKLWKRFCKPARACL